MSRNPLTEKPTFQSWKFERLGHFGIWDKETILTFPLTSSLLELATMSNLYLLYQMKNICRNTLVKHALIDYVQNTIYVDSLNHVISQNLNSALFLS